jgi:hypothetical protein
MSPIPKAQNQAIRKARQLIMAINSLDVWTARASRPRFVTSICVAAQVIRRPATIDVPARLITSRARPRCGALWPTTDTGEHMWPTTPPLSVPSSQKLTFSSRPSSRVPGLAGT